MTGFFKKESLKTNQEKTEFETLLETGGKYHVKPSITFYCLAAEKVVDGTTLQHNGLQIDFLHEPQGGWHGTLFTLEPC